MKLRVKRGTVRQTITCESNGDTTLRNLKLLIARDLELPDGELIEVSLNGIDKLEGEERKLSEFEIVSGDLVIVIQEGQHVDKKPKSESRSQASTSAFSEQPAAAVQVEPSKPSEPSQIGESNSEEMKNETLLAGNDVQEPQSCSMEIDDIVTEATYDSTEVTKCLSEPLLCRESNSDVVPATLNQLYQSAGCRDNNDALWVVIHTLMLESGYSSVSESAKCQAEDYCTMPDAWKQTNHYQCNYQHIALTPDTDITCKLIGLTMGSKLIVHGKLSSNYQTKDVQVKTGDFVSSLTEGAAGTYKNLHRLSMIIKDGLALPLLQELNTALGLPPMFGFLGLNFELKIKILSYLDCASLLRLGDACKQLNSIYKDAYLWRRLHLTTFGGSNRTDLSQNWYEIYRVEYKNRKEYRKRMQQTTFITPDFSLHQPRRFPRFAPVYPHHGIIGGDYDLNPHFHGIPNPLSGRRGRPAADMMRPRYDPLNPLPGHEDPLNPMVPRGRGPPNRTHWFGSAMGNKFF